MTSIKNLVVEFANLEAADDLFDVMNFLSENRKEIAHTFSSQVKLFRANEHLFTGVFHIAYMEALDEFIAHLLRLEVEEHFPDLDPEKLFILTEKSTLDLLTEGYFYNLENYDLAGQISTKEKLGG